LRLDALSLFLIIILQGVKLVEAFRLLLMIQTIDARLNEIQREREESPKEMVKLKEDLDLSKSSMEQDLSSLEELKKKSRSVERELEELETKIKKSKLRLNEVKSNKEYQAVLREIEEIRELTLNKEEDVIAWMEEIELQEKECAQNDMRWKESQEEYKKRETAFLKRNEDLDQEVRSSSEERLKLSQVVDKDLLKRYTTLRSNIKNRVVASAVDGVCQGCHLGIPPQQYNDLIKGDSLQSCPNCNRMIYWAQKENA